MQQEKTFRNASDETNWIGTLVFNILFSFLCGIIRITVFSFERALSTVQYNIRESYKGQ